MTLEGSQIHRHSSNKLPPLDNNNQDNSSMDSSQIQIQQEQPPSTLISIEAIETSIRNLVKRWKRRQRWKLFFSSTEQEADRRVTWRTHLVDCIESTPSRVISITLLLIDLILVTLELSSNLLSCATSKQKKTGEVWYHWLGIVILSLLCLKSATLGLGLGFAFFRRPGFLVEGVVVGGALLLEAFLEREGGGLLVVVSLWRVLRVVESAFELSDEAIEAQIERIRYQFEALREENGKLVQIISEKDELIEKLQEELCLCLQNHA